MPKPPANKKVNYIFDYVQKNPDLIKELKLTSFAKICIKTDQLGQKYCMIYFSKLAERALDDCFGSSNPKPKILQQSSHISIYESQQPAWNCHSTIAFFHMAFYYHVSKQPRQAIFFYFDEHGFLVNRTQSSALSINTDFIDIFTSTGTYLSILKDIYKIMSSATAKYGPQLFDPAPRITYLYCCIDLFQSLIAFFKLLDSEHEKDFTELFKRAFPESINISKYCIFKTICPALDFSSYELYFSDESKINIHLQILLAIRLLDIFKKIHANDPNFSIMFSNAKAGFMEKLNTKISDLYTNSINLDTLFTVLEGEVLSHNPALKM